MLFDHDLEATVNGTILMAPKGVDLFAAAGLLPRHFHGVPAAAIYGHCLVLHDRGVSVDPFTLKGLLRTADHAALDWTLGMAETPTPSRVQAWATRLIELALWRGRHSAAAEMQNACVDRNEQRFAECEQALAKGVLPDDSTYTPDQLGDRFYRYLDKDARQVFTWPFTRLDDLTSGGMRRGEVTLVGGWSSHGKSAFVDQTLHGLARADHHVHLYINEMTPEQRVARFVARDANVQLGELLRNRVNPAQLRRVMTSLGRVPYAMTDVAGWNADEIARHIRRVRPDVACIDILHLIPHRDESDLRDISRIVNVAAKRADCHILATVHLNESRVMGQTRPMPTLGDIRGSGMLKNDADNTLMIFREQDADTGYPQHESTAYFAKVRSGMPGGVELTFDGTRTEFTERDSWRSAR